MPQIVKHAGLTIVSYFIFMLLSACSTSHETSKQVKEPVLQSIPLELTTTSGNQQTFTDGEEIQFLLSLGDDAFIYMYHLDASNTLIQILPNPLRHGHYFKKGYFLTIPDYDNGFRFKAGAPFGDGTVRVFASDVSVEPGENLTIDEIKEFIEDASERAFGFASFDMIIRQR